MTFIYDIRDIVAAVVLLGALVVMGVLWTWSKVDAWWRRRK